jgi:hypothetical protein
MRGGVRPLLPVCPEGFFAPINIHRSTLDMRGESRAGLHVKCQLLLPDFNQNMLTFRKNPLVSDVIKRNSAIFETKRIGAFFLTFHYELHKILHFGQERTMFRYSSCDGGTEDPSGSYPNKRISDKLVEAIRSGRRISVFRTNEVQPFDAHGYGRERPYLMLQ